MVDWFEPGEENKLFPDLNQYYQQVKNIIFFVCGPVGGGGGGKESLFPSRYLEQ